MPTIRNKKTGEVIETSPDGVCVKVGDDENEYIYGSISKLQETWEDVQIVEIERSKK